MSLASYAHALDGSVAGRNRIACPGPGHSRRDRSLSVLFDPMAPDGFVVHSHAGDDPLDCKDHVRCRLGLPEPERRVPTRSAPPAADLATDTERTARALALWHQAASPDGTPVESYLHSRGIDLPSLRASDAIRWHRACPFAGERVGCMVALVRDIVTDEPKAIHRTAIDDDGRKLSHLGANGRMSLGPVGGGAVKLTADEDVSLAVVIGEGIESCLSTRNVPGLSAMPLWALLSAGQVAHFPVLGGVETLWIVVDHDDTGIASSQAVGIRWQESSREVITITPTMAGADLNDVVRGRNHA